VYPRLLALVVVAGCLIPRLTAAQGWPAETPTLAGGRIALGGELTLTVAPDDDGGFNTTDYDISALQLVRLGLSATIRPIERLTIVTELRAEGDTSGGPWTALPSTLYARVRPWRNYPFDIQAGRIPPVFGAAGRRVYAHDNVLIGSPLAWQYLTVLRSDSVPANADELLYARDAAYGYSVGGGLYERGVALASAYRYDTGVEARLGDDRWPVSVSAALTAGTLSQPGLRDSNGGPQFSTRVAFRPVIGLEAGASFAEARFLADDVDEDLPPEFRDERYTQRTWGADFEYSRAHWLVRAELVSARWRLPALERPWLDHPLRSTAFSIEGRYRLLPGLTVATRLDRQTFNDVRGTYVERPWDAPLTRVETGLSYAITRQLIGRFSVQVNDRTRGDVQRAIVPAAQVTWWF
jgi:hypothetical protein